MTEASNVKNQSILDAAVNDVTALPFDEIVERFVGKSEQMTVASGSASPTVGVVGFWDDAEGGDIRLILSLPGRGIRRFLLPPSRSVLVKSPRQREVATSESGSPRQA